MSQVFFPFSPATDLTGRTFDPYFPSVELLLLGIGANGGATITDSSSRANTITVNGATTSTAQSKFSTSSILHGGNGGTSKRFSVATWVGGGGTLPGLFTFEGWVRDGGNNVIWYAGTRTSTHQWYLYNDVLQHDDASNNQVTGYAAKSSWANGAWHHWMISRDGSNNLYTFGDGTLISTNTNSATIDFSLGAGLMFGNYGPTGNLCWQGYSAPTRLTKGVCRATASFTVPSTAYPPY